MNTNGDTSYLWHAQYAPHTAPTHVPAGIEGVRTHASNAPLAYVYRSFHSREQMCLALSKLEIDLMTLHSLVGSKIRRAGREILY